MKRPQRFEGEVLGWTGLRIALRQRNQIRRGTDFCHGYEITIKRALLRRYEIISTTENMSTEKFAVRR
jgi:hypothetical protein